MRRFNCYGIKIQGHVTCNVDCETKIRDFIDTVLRLGKEFSDRVQIEYVHRVRGADSNRSIIVNFLSVRDKDVIFKRRKRL